MKQQKPLKPGNRVEFTSPSIYNEAVIISISKRQQGAPIRVRLDNGQEWRVWPHEICLAWQGYR